MEHSMLNDERKAMLMKPETPFFLFDLDRVSHNLMKHGYFPVTKQIFCTLYKPEEGDYTENTHRGLMMELR